MPEYLFEPPVIQAIPVVGQTALFPVNRIFCVGRNYAAHAAEMGVEVDREAPFYFTKSASAVQLSGARAPYPPGTSNFHYEMELAVAIGAPAFRASPADAMGSVFGYGCALDMTRRDLQQAGKDKRRPWDLGKDVEQSAVLAPLTSVKDFTPGTQRIQLSVNGEMRQDATLDEMVWSVPEIIADLSKFYHLRAGDIIMTGTPAGVGAVVAGDRLSGGIEGLQPILHDLGDAE